MLAACNVAGVPPDHRPVCQHDEYRCKVAPRAETFPVKRLLASRGHDPSRWRGLVVGTGPHQGPAPLACLDIQLAAPIAAAGLVAAVLPDFYARRGLPAGGSGQIGD